MRLRAQFANVDGELANGEVLPLCRLRYGRPASRDGYQDSVLPSGLPIGTPEEALDCACGL